MTKAEFIKRFNLTKTNTKALFNDGLTRKSRTLYTGNHGLYVFYNKDLHLVRAFKNSPYVEGMEEFDCILGAAYSWYH